MVVGSMLLGIKIALIMKKRVEELRELERIIRYLEGEIRYRHSILSEACACAAARTGQPFSEWLNYLSESLTRGDDDFPEIWESSLHILYAGSELSKKDVRELLSVGRTLGYLDIEAQRQGLTLECENMRGNVGRAESELSNRMKLSVILGTLGGILIVIMLL